MPDPSSFAALPDDRLALWKNFCRWDTTYFPSFVGLQVEEIRLDYARLRLPFRPELNQPAGVVHGGAIATLIDTVVVPAVGAAYPAVPVMFTLGMNISYLSAIRDCDAVAEGWVTQRGRSIVFCEAEVRSDDGTLAAKGSLTYKIRVG